MPPEPRPFAPPDHSDPAARDATRVTAPLAVGDRATWVEQVIVPRPGHRKPVRRTIDHPGYVREIVGDLVTLALDEPDPADAATYTEASTTSSTWRGHGRQVEVSWREVFPR